MNEEKKRGRKQYDLIGKVYGYLQVVEKAAPYISPKGQILAKWHCVCNRCGKHKDVLQQSLLAGATTSCGCLQKDIVSNPELHKHPIQWTLCGDIAIGKTKKGAEFIIDADDMPKVSQHNWFVINGQGYLYNATVGLLHRYIMSCPDDKIVDHINGDVKNNRKANLRICTKAENSYNRKKHRNNTTGCSGVQYLKDLKKYKAGITCNHQYHYLGLYDKYEEAVQARIQAEIDLFGDFRRKS